MNNVPLVQIYEKKSQVSPASLNGGSSFEIERPRVVTHDKHRREITNHNKYHRSIARTLTVGCVCLYIYMYIYVCDRLLLDRFVLHNLFSRLPELYFERLQKREREGGIENVID